MGIISLLLGVLLALAAGCAPPAEQEAETETETEQMAEADRQAIEELRSQYEELYNNQDATGLANLYAEDAVASLPNQEPTRGRAAIQAAIESEFAQYETTLSIAPEATEVAGDWAFDAGTTSQTLTPREEGEALDVTSSYIVIVERQADGSWKLGRVVVSSDMAPPPPPEEQ